MDPFELARYQYHSDPFNRIYASFENSKLTSPRGQLVKELENFSYVLPPYVRFANFRSRKLSLDYIRKEFIWYLRGDRFDTSICEHAKMWAPLVNEDGSVNSNYGQYIFGQGGQFLNALHTLKHDKDTRRASMTILDRGHLLSNTKDVPCTYALNFRIRENVLKMTVHMRSQDAVYGMGNDAPAFSFVHEMMFNALKETYPDIVYGEYCHFADSFHVYQRHFEMLEKLSKGDEYSVVDCPKISGPDEVKFLLRHDFSRVPDEFQFSKWLSEGGR